MIVTHNLDYTDEGDTTEYAVYRYLFIKATEGVRRAVYFDTSPDHNPTIGIGFNLKVRAILKSVLDTFGIKDDDAAVRAFEFIIAHTAQGTLQAALNQKLAEYPSANRSAFTYSAGETGITEMRPTFDLAVKIHEKSVKSWLADVPPSKERAVLLSLSYNGVLNKSPSLKQAIIDGNRAEAWFEIRYNTNKGSLDATPPDGVNGIAKRRFYEAEVFSLYESGDQVKDKNEALQVYRMFTAHRDKILKYEAAYGNLYGKPGNRGDWITEANRDYSLNQSTDYVNTLVLELNSSAENLMQEYIKNEYGVVRDFNYLNIQVAGDKAIILRGEDNTTRTGSMDDLLIGDYDNGVFLYGYSGNDLLVGGNGEDILNGGADKDTLIGGAGQDNMSGGDGNDTFIIEGSDTAYDTFNGGAGEDTILGGTGDDTIRLHNFTGDDRIEIIDGGGGENNIIAGTIGNDIFDFTGVTLRHIKEIRGNGGNDTYIVNHGGAAGSVTIEDKDGKNRVLLDGEVLSLLIKRADGSYYSPDKAVTADLVGNSDLRVVGRNGSVVILNEDFQEGDFGINFIDEFETIADPEITGITKHGDLKPTEFKNDNGGIYYKSDSNGNIIVDDQAESGRNDTLYGTGANDLILGHGGNDLLWGKAGGDRLEGGSGDDGIAGEEGNDLLLGGEGKDRLFGGVGNDHLDGGSGNDYVLGQEGDDLLIGGTDNDRIFGDDGNDQLFAEEKKDVLDLIQEGETGTGTGARGDLLSGGDGEDQLYGGAGNDVLMGGSGVDVIYGGAGDDTIEGDSGITLVDDDWSVARTIEERDGITWYKRQYNNAYNFDTASETHGDDFIFAGAGNDWVFSGGGDDYIDAGTGDDVVFGEAGNDTIFGQGGNDVLNGDSLSGVQGDDYIDGGAGNDQLFGGGGTDVLFGGTDDDRLQGGEGNDQLFGDDGVDLLFGEDGDDTLSGGADNDELQGGEGNDQLYGAIMVRIFYSVTMVKIPCPAVPGMMNCRAETAMMSFTVMTA